MFINQRLRDQQMCAIETHFSPKIVAWAHRTMHKYAEQDIFISRLVLGEALNLIPAEIRARAPTSVDDFISAIDPVFNDATLIQIAANIRGFDAIAGIPCAESFVIQKSIWDWVEGIVEQHFLGFDTLAGWTQPKVTGITQSLVDNSGSLELSSKWKGKGGLKKLKEVTKKVSSFIEKRKPSS